MCLIGYSNLNIKCISRTFGPLDLNRFEGSLFHIREDFLGEDDSKEVRMKLHGLLLLC